LILYVVWRTARISKKKKSQDDLAKIIVVLAPVIGRYELKKIIPTIEVATKMVVAFSVSLDYLVGIVVYELDNAITQKILSIQTINEEDKNLLFKTIDALLRNANARKTYA
jgi:transcriptional regulator with XRE-family HTH domain